MFKVFLTSLFAVSMFTSPILADDLPATQGIALSKSFAPIGFDNNDRSQVVVAGEFPSTCYRVGPHALKINNAQKTITIQQQTYVYGGICIRMVVPFTQVIDLGLLAEGTYSVQDYTDNHELGKLVVARSKNAGPDDFLYAPVSDAYIKHLEGGKNELVLSGSFSDRCSEIEKVTVLYQDQVLVVQPIMKRTGGENCEKVKTRFFKTVMLEKEIHGNYLLHVRSLDGQAVNKIVDVP